jgi:SAM-dependent methyltransferase
MTQRTANPPPSSAGLVCPICRTSLDTTGGDLLACRSCRRQYPIVAGLPDLRLHADPYVELEADRRKGLDLIAATDRVSFDACIDAYYERTDRVPAWQARAFAAGLRAAPARVVRSLAGWERASGGAPAGALLDVGCGTAPLLAAAAGRYGPLAGIDLAFRWLVLGRRRLEERGVEARLVAAGADALPFPDGSFARVVFDASLEHVRDQPRALAEAYRVLVPGGWVWIATPNRFSLGPDPHTGVWLGSWRSEQAVARQARRRGAVPPVRQLLSALRLHRLIAGTGFEEARIYPPDIAGEQRDALSPALRPLADLYRALRRLPVGRGALLVAGPLIHAVARKPARARRRAGA